LVKILHFKLHPDDRFSWAAGQSTHYRSTHRSSLFLFFSFSLPPLSL
jgi:hypothetical protein